MKTERARAVEFQWFLHDACNYRCPYCEVSGARRVPRPRQESLRPAADWVAAWERMHGLYGECSLHITGGEPTVFPGFMDLLAAVCRRHWTAFDTNLSWSPEQWDAFAARIPADRVRVLASFHPHGAPAEEVAAKAAALVRKGYDCTVRLVAFPPLLAEIGRFRDLFRRAGVPFAVNPYQGGHDGRSYPGDYTDAQRALIAEAGEDGHTAHILEMHRQSPQGRTCRSGHSYALVDHDGEVFRCRAYEARRWERLGSLLDPGFRLREEPAPCRATVCEAEFRLLLPQEPAR